MYIWKPIFDPPYDATKLRKDGQSLTPAMLKKVEEFEIKMRSQSVATLCFFALLVIVMAADHNQRPDVSIIQWFGLKINLEAIKYTFRSLMLNSVLFAGEIFQILKGMVVVNYNFDILSYKNLIFAPLLEEFIYRVCLINLFMESRALTQT